MAITGGAGKDNEKNLEKRQSKKVCCQRCSKKA